MYGAGAVSAGGEPLLEREREQAKIEERLSALLAGSGGVLAVEAEAGLGKTVLLETVSARARLRGARVLGASGSAQERQLPFGMVRDLLDDARVRGGIANADQGDPAEVSKITRERLEHWSPNDGSVMSRLRDLHELVRDLADESPLVLVLDDAHYADADSLRWLHYVQRRLASLPVLVALAANPAEPGVHSSLLAPLLDESGSTLLRPARLSRAAVEEIVRRRFPAPAPEFVPACHTATGGNPFLLHQLLGECRDATAEEAERVPTRSSAGIARSLAMRMDLLPAPAMAVARAAAVLDDGAELRQVAQLAGAELADATRAVDALTAMRILNPERPLTFEYSIVRAAIYGGLTHGERSLAHASAARLVSDEGATPERVAAHLVQTEPSADEWVLKTLCEAARTAAQRGAGDVAIPLLQRALREPPAPFQRFGVMLELGKAQAKIDSAAAALRTLAAAREAADGQEQVVEATIHQARVLTLSGHAAEAIDMLVDALDPTLRDRELRGRLDAEIAGTLQLTCDQTAASARRSGPILHRAHRAAHGFRALQAAYRGFSAQETAELALATLAETRSPAAADGEQPLTALMAIDVLAVCGQLGAAEQELERARRLAEEQGSSIASVGIASVAARLALARGELAAAQAVAESGLVSARAHGWLLIVPALLSVLLDVLVERGELAAAAELANGASASGAFSDSLYAPLLRASVGRLEVSRGAVRDGLECALLAGEHAIASGMLNPALLPWRSDAARAHLLLGEHDRARTLAEDELALARAFGAPRALGIALTTAGLLGTDAAEGLLLEAVAALSAAGASVELARARVELGALLRHRAPRCDAQASLRLGLDGAHRCGAAALEARARQELAAIGSRPRRALMRGPEALTPCERIVAKKAATGQTNRAIAAELFVTVKTVEAHLSKSYRKLGVSTRAEIAAHLDGGRVRTDPDKR